MCKHVAWLLSALTGRVDGGDNALAQWSDGDLPAGRAAWALAGILALAALILVIPAGRRVFWSSDEARFAILAQDIIDHQRWLVPELRGSLYLNKPQLHFWSIALVSLPVGRVTELTAAIPAVLSALGAVGAVVAIGKLLWGWPAGLLAGLVLATAPPLFVFGHVALPDMMLAHWMMWSLYWFLRAWCSDWARGPLAGFYLCVGLAVASKGPAGYAALAGALAAVAGAAGVREFRRLRPLLGVLILALSAAPWLVPYHLTSGGQFGRQVLIGHYAAWYLGGGFLDRLRPTASALVSFLPWTIFLAAAPGWWRHAPDPGRRQVGLWTLAVWILLGVTGTPRSRYLVPIYPLLALLVGEFLARARARGGGPVLRVAAVLFGVGVMVAVAGLAFPSSLMPDGEDAALFPEARWERALDAALIVLAGLVVWILSRRARSGAMGGAVAAAMAGILALMGLAYPARYARENDVRPLAAAAAAHSEPGAAVIAHPDLRLSYYFYLHRPVIEIASEEAMATRLSAPPREAVITSLTRWRQLAPRAAPSWHVLDTRRVGGREMVVVGGR